MGTRQHHNMKNKIKNLGITVALATGSGYQGIDLTIQSVFGIITGLACWFTDFALVLIVVYVVIYGVKFMMAQGDPTKYGKAKVSLKWGLLGILIILGTYTIIFTVADFLGGDYTLLTPLICS